MKKITKKQVKDLLFLPLNDLIFKAQTIHKKNFKNPDVQLASLISIKTGSCPEDCKYCPQSAHYNVDLKKENLIELSRVKKAATLARNNGAHRFCMGAAWRQVKDNADFERVLEMVRTVKALDLETCATLGMITKEDVIIIISNSGETMELIQLLPSIKNNKPIAIINSFTSLLLII